MPTVTEIETTYSRKLQLDQFEPVEHAVTLRAEIGDGESTDDAYDDLSDRAEELVEQALARRVTQKKLADSDDEDDE